jgi:hypothetical protein
LKWNTGLTKCEQFEFTETLFQTKYLLFFAGHVIYSFTRIHKEKLDLDPTMDRKVEAIPRPMHVYTIVVECRLEAVYYTGVTGDLPPRRFAPPPF